MTRQIVSRYKAKFWCVWSKFLVVRQRIVADQEGIRIILEFAAFQCAINARIKSNLHICPPHILSQTKIYLVVYLCTEDTSWSVEGPRGKSSNQWAARYVTSSGHIQILAVGHTRGITVHGFLLQGIEGPGVVNIALSIPSFGNGLRKLA